ncbi:hypothetical protein CEXT_308501 [Caerostris extrusa]|uniref:Uncharacterized protein n=1 Tax=Caerostris extrusa TaxID=172846 RepID=A0AAV4YBT6_CAEEX|nr:hypothetical protein CEXT_308501 [Caerostris extrusa]
MANTESNFKSNPLRQSEPTSPHKKRIPQKNNLEKNAVESGLVLINVILYFSEAQEAIQYIDIPPLANPSNVISCSEDLVLCNSKRMAFLDIPQIDCLV